MPKLETPLVSVIIPAYNPSLSLFSACINSVLNQGVSLDIIVVDDGSEPEVAIALDRFAEQNRGLRVVHQENGGVCAARNTGLRCATGEFIVFVDADDELAPGWLSKAIDVAVSTTASIVMGKVVMTPEVPARIDSDNTNAIRVFEEDELWLLQREFLLNTTGLVGPLEYLDLGVCSKLLRRSCIDGLYFPVGITLSEDQVFNHSALRRACRCAVTDATAYYYIVNQDSVTHGFHADAIEMMMKSMNLIKPLLYDNAEIKTAFARRVLDEIAAALAMSAFSDASRLSFAEQKKYVQKASEEPLLREAFAVLDIRMLPSFKLRLKAVMLKYKWCSLYSWAFRAKSRFS